MKVAILHHDLEEIELKIKEYLEKNGISAFFVDIREATLDKFEEIDVVLNRIYASVSNRDYASTQKTLELLKLLEEKGICCWNSYKTSFYDYNKFEAYLLLKKHDIPTPETLFIGSKNDIDIFIEDAEKKFDFPMVIKRNTGGRGKDVTKVDSKGALRENLAKKFILAEKEKYYGGFVVQEFINSSKDFDCRLGIVESQFAFNYGRTLVKDGGKEKWLASVSKGSKRVDCSLSEKEIALGLKVSELIGADFNVIDLMFTEKGPMVIENNPTPNYVSGTSNGVFKQKDFLKAILQGLHSVKITERPVLLTRQ